jgi:hypothetical protein
VNAVKGSAGRSSKRAASLTSARPVNGYVGEKITHSRLYANDISVC